jgi:creatine kinase
LLNGVFDRLERALGAVSALDGLLFVASERYGAVTSCPTNLGSGMRASVHVPLPNLTRDGTDETAMAIARRR